MKKGQTAWTREELILSLNLYLKLPFGKLHSRTTEIIELASLIGRTSNAVSMRLNNFASVDPFHKNRGIVGLDGGKNQVQPIWDEFINDKDELLFESEAILAKKQKTTLEKKYFDELGDFVNLRGFDKLSEVKTRVNQNVFREIVLANYEFSCAITGIDIRALLRASHILPWSTNEKERLNPENGICLSPTFDCAFDRGYIGINNRHEVVFSSELKKKAKSDYYQDHFSEIEGRKIRMPKKYIPKKEFLEFHLETILIK